MSKSQPIFIYGVNLKDERGRLKQCQLCNQKFSMSLKEHQCKRCKRAVCEKCAMNKALIQKGDSVSKKPHRLCNFCKDESDSLKKFVEQYKVQFAQDSFASQWLQVYGCDTVKAKNDFGNAINDSREVKETQPYDIFKAKLEVVINDIDGFANYSLKEFLVIALRNIEPFRQKEVVKQSILKVAGTFLLMYPQIGYSHEIIILTYILLCFCSEASAYVLLTAIYANIIPSQLYPKNNIKYDFVNEMAIIAGVLTDVYRIENNDLIVIKSFLKEKLKRFILLLGINLYLFETTFFILNSIFISGSNAYMDLIAQMAILCVVSNKEMQKNKYAHEETEAYMLRSIRTNDLSLLYKQTQNCDLESYQKVYITSRSESIRADNLNFSSRTASLIKPDMLKLSDINQKLQEQVMKRDETIQQQNMEINQLKEQIKQLTKENNVYGLQKNKLDNNDAELYKIKLHEIRIDNSDLKAQIEQQLKTIDYLKSQLSVQQGEIKDLKNDLDVSAEVQLIKMKYETQVRSLQKQIAELNAKQLSTSSFSSYSVINEEKQDIFEQQNKSKYIKNNDQNDSLSKENKELKFQNQELTLKILRLERLDKQSVNDLLEEKNNEIELLTQLNEELTNQNEKLKKELRDQKSVSSSSTLQQIKVLEEQKKELEDLVTENEKTSEELLQNINRLHSQTPQIIEFSEKKIPMKGKEDLDDAKRIAETKAVQNQILRSLLKDNQAQLLSFSSTINQLRDILNRPKGIIFSKNK